MGSSHNVPDPNIILSMDLDREYYIAGQEVHGCVFLEAKCQRAYSALQILVMGEQYVFWSTGSGKNRRSYRNHHKSYDNSFTLHNFQGTVPQGQFSFPFTFQLPAMMSGSFTYSSNCYIQYTCSARLTHLKMKQSQLYPIHLNILEPPRSPPSSISVQQNVHSQCCGCCKDYGETTVNMNCNKNFIVTGENFLINGSIDHSRGKVPIEMGKIVLEQRRIMVSSGGSIRSSVDYSLDLYGINQKINPGTVYNFNFQSTLPNNLMSYTAIGRVTARYFLIRLMTEYGCCANTAFACLHVIVHSQTPKIMVRPPKKISPNNFYPQEFPLVVCQQMAPYVYSPLPQIRYLNMPGQNQEAYVNVPNNYINYQPQFNPYEAPQYNGQYNETQGGYNNNHGQQPYFEGPSNNPIKY